LCALFSKQHPSAHRFYRSYGYSSLIVYSRSMELRIETFGKLFSASEGFMYDDRPLFLSFFYSDTLFGLVMQIVKELKFYLPRRMFCFRFRATAKIRVTLLLLFPILIVGQIVIRGFTPQIFQRAIPLHDQRSRQSGTYERLCRSSRR